MAKIEISLGALSFSAEGEEKWLTDQFKFAIGQLDSLAKIAAPLSAADQKEEAGSVDTGDKPVGSLVAHLKDRNAEASQNRKFLATADWLRRKGETNLKTGLITSALKDGHQKRLGNASQALANNVNQGFIEKDGQSFFITNEGLKELGYRS